MSKWTKAEASQFVTKKKFLGQVTQDALRPKIERLYEMQGIAMNEGRVLRYLLDRPEGEIPSAIADELNIPRPSITKLLDELEKQGYVQRLSIPEDRRKVRVCLMPKGIEKAQELSVFHNAFHADVMMAFTKEEIDVYFSVKKRLREETERQLQIRQAQMEKENQK